ncbi:MAG: TetR/AcrR family transcriptional regulator, partial [Sphingomonadaceae bacterium]
MEVIATDSREAILNAAEQIINYAGYAGLSMRELSTQSGLAKSTLYHYFEDKHQIYLSVLERDMARTVNDLAAAAAIDGPPMER